MEKTDKAVSTEDLCVEPQRTMCLEVAKLEAVFKTLVENKVEAIKNDKVRLSSVHSSPKSLANRLRITSSSSAASSRGPENHHHRSSYCHHSPNRKHRRRRKSCDEDELSKDAKRARRSGRSKNRVSSSSPESPRYRMHRCCDRRQTYTDDEAHETVEFLHCDSICSADDYISIAATSHPCCCPERNGQIKMHHYNSDYVSLKIEDFDDMDEEAIIDREALRRARRKRRRRRKKRMKGHIEITAMPVPEVVKEIDPEELPQRARWTIVATACLLLFMCLLLVGVTLRMAPIIDDMVRKENEELMNSLHREPSGHHSGSHHNFTPAQAQPQQQQ